MDEVFGQQVDLHVDTAETLRELEPLPSHWVNSKDIGHVDDLSRRFIAASSLVVLSTSRSDGELNLTPRGDPAGFVKVLNDRLLAVPDRPGNKRMDAFNDVFGNPNVGLIFIIPGHRDTLRVTGQGAVVKDAALGEKLAVNGRPAELVLLVRVQRVLCHCPKAFIRGKVWQPEDWPDTSDVPTLAEMLKVHGAMAEAMDAIEAGTKDDRENNLY